MKHAPPPLALSLALCAACASGARPAGGRPYEVGGSYGGRLVVERQSFDGVLILRGAGARLTGTLRIMEPFHIDGRVRAERIDELLRLNVTYRGEDGCQGSIEGILTISPDGDTVAGPVTVLDCDQAVAGSLSFRR